MIFLDKENHFSAKNHVQKQYYVNEFCVYTFTTYQFENCIQYSSVVWLDEKVSFVISYIFREIIDYTTNIIWRLMYYCFFKVIKQYDITKSLNITWRSYDMN